MEAQCFTGSTRCSIPTFPNRAHIIQTPPEMHETVCRCVRQHKSSVMPRSSERLSPSDSVTRLNQHQIAMTHDTDTCASTNELGDRVNEIGAVVRRQQLIPRREEPFNFHSSVPVPLCRPSFRLRRTSFEIYRSHVSEKRNSAIEASIINKAHVCMRFLPRILGKPPLHPSEAHSESKREEKDLFGNLLLRQKLSNVCRNISARLLFTHRSEAASEM